MPGERGRRTVPLVLAVDGGNSKVDAVLVDRSGHLLGAARRVAPANVGRSDGADTLTEVILSAVADAGIARSTRAVAPFGVYCLAGADFPLDERRIDRMLSSRGWTRRNVVRNDTFAVLRAGTDRGWGVALVCGAGMNCLGVGPRGERVRFPALGVISGDLAAGGEWMGTTALAAAVRGRDGRGTRTVLERSVPAHFGLARPEAVSRALHRGSIPSHRLIELPPLVFEAAAAADPVARAILDALADEVVAMITATIRRLRARSTDVDVILGGGMFRASDAGFLERITDGVAAVAPRAVVRPLRAPPVLGAALIGLDEAGAPAAAASRLRAGLTETRLGSAGPRSQPARQRSDAEV
jgi:N-acetylglucosamine kinase-like BadF-type ATPase